MMRRESEVGQTSPGGSGRLRRLVLRLLRFLLGVFFREIEVLGRENVPIDRGGLMVSWHPNALVDPALILAFSPRPVAFGARHGLFHWPILGALLRALGTVPIYRAGDDRDQSVAARREANQRSLDALAERIAAGDYAALFPEGQSHDHPHPVDLKTGIARLYYRASELSGQRSEPAIVPVGLHYDNKTRFRSRVLVWFHAPIGPRAPESGRSADPDDHGRIRALTSQVDAVLREVVHATEDWETHRVLHRARKLLRAETARRSGEDPGRPGVSEQVDGFARIRRAYLLGRERFPARIAELRSRVSGYDDDLKALELEDHDLDGKPPLPSVGRALLLGLQATAVLLVSPPLVLLGILVNLPAAWCVRQVAHRASGALRKDEATLKIMAGAVLFPIVWGALGVAAGVLDARVEPEVVQRFSPVWVGLTVALAVALSGAATLAYVSFGRRTFRAIRVRVTRARMTRSLARLRRERGRIYDELVGLPEVVEEGVSAGGGAHSSTNRSPPSG